MTRLDDIIETAPDGHRVAGKIVCADGFSISAQASSFHYCTDSTGRRGEPLVPPFTSVECGYPSERPEPWGDWGQYAEEPDDPTGTVYGYVPVDTVRTLIESHGGER